MYADLVLHFGVSALIAVFDPALAALAGLLKEGYDAAFGGVASLLDLAADGLGILFGWVLTTL